MSAKNITILILPSIVFLLVAVDAFVVAQTARHYHDYVDRVGVSNQQKLETLSEQVESGKLQIPPDRWLALLRKAQAVADSERAVSKNAGIAIQGIVELSAGGVILQLAAVLIVRRRLQNAA